MFFDLEFTENIASTTSAMSTMKMVYPTTGLLAYSNSWVQLKCIYNATVQVNASRGMLQQTVCENRSCDQYLCLLMKLPNPSSIVYQPGVEICRVIDGDISTLMQQIRIDRKRLVCFHPSVFNGSISYGRSTSVVDPELRFPWKFDGDLQDF